MMLLGRSHIVLLIINVQASFFISQLLSVDISIQVPCCFCRCRRAPPLWSFQKLSPGSAVQLGLPEKIGLFGKNICNWKRGEGLSAASCSVNGGGIIRRSLSHCAILCDTLCEAVRGQWPPLLSVNVWLRGWKQFFSVIASIEFLDQPRRHRLEFITLVGQYAARSHCR